MEHLPQTKGKGVLMFAKRRQRMDELSAEQEEMRQKGTPVDASEVKIAMPAFQEESAQASLDVHVKKQQQYQEQPYQQQMLPQSANGMNGLDQYQGSATTKATVPNRTAKPFLGGHNEVPETFSPIRGVSSPTHKKPDNIFKVPIPVNTAPKVWSPTADVIASRDERIAIPAIKTGILPETKRKGANKTGLKEGPRPEKKGEQRSESGLEEDFLSLGAEACNFMQAPTVKQKNPPPVLPKPAINPAHPPWSAEIRTSRSPLPATSPVPAIALTPVQAVPQQNLSQPALPAWAPTHLPALHHSPWTLQPHQALASHHTPDSRHAGPSQSKSSWTKPQNDGNSIASCPPQHRGSSFYASKAPSAPIKGYSGASDGLNLKGKGGELFARRQSRMEKFVVDDETVRANKARSPSPTLSMPSTWKYSSNVRAPPPVSYNPILSPSYPLAAVKQPPPATSPKAKPKTNKDKTKPSPKHLNVLDVMKHQPYQLDSSLFTYNFTPESKEAIPKQVHTPASLQAQSPAFEPCTMPSSSSNMSFRGSQPAEQNPSKVAGQALSRSRSLSLPQRLSSVSPASTVSSPGAHPTREPLNRQFSWVEQPKKPHTSLEAFVQNPFGLNEAGLSASHRKSLPETSAEWGHRVSYESPQEMGPITAVTSPTRAFSSIPEKPVIYGPPFRPAQPLGTSNRYNRGSSLPRNFSLHSTINNPQSHRVSWKL